MNTTPGSNLDKFLELLSKFINKYTPFRVSSYLVCCLCGREIVDVDHHQKYFHPELPSNEEEEL